MAETHLTPMHYAAECHHCPWQEDGYKPGVLDRARRHYRRSGHHVRVQESRTLWWGHSDSVRAPEPGKEEGDG